MARIRTIERGSRNVRAHVTETDLAYQVVEDANGERLLHIATFGSDARQDVGTTSQSMQFNRDRAEELLRVVRTTFPEIL